MIAQNRDFIVLGLIAIIYLLYRKLRKSKRFATLITLSIILLAVLCSFRFENFIIRYDTIESALIGSGNRGIIQKVVETEKSALLIYGNDSSSSTLVIYKDEDKWRVPVIKSKNIMVTLKDGSTLIMNKENGNDNYYIMLTVNSKNCTIKDSENTNFEQFIPSKNNDIFNYITKYISFVENIGKGYYIEINGNRFDIL